MSELTFEVRFRGQNSYEAEAPVLQHHGEFRAWKPSPGKMFECEELRARARYGEILRDGIQGVTVDGIVPYVVEIVELEYFTRGGVEYRRHETLLWSYAEVDAIPSGPWAEVAEHVDDRGHAGMSVDAMAN